MQLTQENVNKAVAELYAATTPEAQAQVLKTNEELFKLANARDRRVSRLGMPMYAGMLDRAQENKYYDKARAVKDFFVLGAAGTFAVTAGKWVWGLFRG